MWAQSSADFEEALLASAMMEESEDPLMTAMNDFFVAFMAAGYSDQWSMVTDMLTTTPELCDSEMAFEITNTLFDEAMAAGDYERFMALLAEIETLAPQAWESNLNLMLEWRASSALMRGDDATVRESFITLSAVAGHDLDTYYRALSHFAWHGDLDMVVTGLQRALPSVKASHEVVPWAASELAEMVATFELFQAVGSGAPLSEWETVLVDRFTHEYGLEVSAQFGQALAYSTGEKTPLTDWDAYVLDPSAEGDDDPGRVQLSFLIDGLCHYAWHEIGMPLSRIAQVRDHIGRYLILSGLGQLAKQKRSRPKKARRAGQLPYLIPQRRRADTYISEHIVSFLFTPVHDIAAFVELLVALPEYLHSLQMVTARQVQDARADLRPLRDSVAQDCDTVTHDPAPGTHLRSLLR